MNCARVQRLISLCIGLGGLATPASGSDPATQVAPRAAQDAALHQILKVFDFDERRLGNFDEAPLHWDRLDGAGLPGFARGYIDDDVGHRAAPSFRLEAQTASVAYEYRQLDLAITPESTYLIRAFVRAERMVHSAAFLAAYLVDRFGQRIPGSDAVSNLVRSDGAGAWQPVELVMPTRLPRAHRICLQLWVAQAHCWAPPESTPLDPIVNTDVAGRAWFDDISIIRLPRAALRLAGDATVLKAGESAEFAIDVQHAQDVPLTVELSVADPLGTELHRQRLDIAADRNAMIRPFSEDSTHRDAARSPDAARATRLSARTTGLAAGDYVATLRVLSAGDAVLTRTLDFVVVPDLGKPRDPTRIDLGVDLGPWRGGDVDDAVALIAALGAQAVKVGVEMGGVESTIESAARLREISLLTRELQRRGIDVTAVALGAPREAGQPAEALQDLVTNPQTWSAACGAVLSHFGGAIPVWQLGDESLELSNRSGWSAESLAAARRTFRRYLTLPQLAVPGAVSESGPGALEAGEVRSVWFPGRLPARSIPQMLRWVVENDGPRCWLTIGMPEAGSGGDGPEPGLEDLARRLVLSKSLGLERVYVPAPVRLSDASGRRVLVPTRAYIGVRTLLSVLAGRRARAVLRPAPDTLAILFDDGDASCMAIWTWRDQALPEPVRMYIGPTPVLRELNGATIPLETDGDFASVPVRPGPVFVEQLNAAMAALQGSYRFAPTAIEVRADAEQPVLSFRNPYDAPMVGELRLTVPTAWTVSPATRRFVLRPGEELRQVLQLGVPPRQPAAQAPVDVQISIQSPQAAELQFSESIEISLRDIALDASSSWSGDTLLVELTLRNRSTAPVSFAAFCAPPGRKRLRGQFLDVEPGQFLTNVFRFPDSRELSGGMVYVGVEEVEGQRVLNRLVEVPH